MPVQVAVDKVTRHFQKNEIGRKEQKKFEFERCLHPLLVLMHAIGVPLYFQNCSCPHCWTFSDRRFKWITTFFGFLLFFLNVEIHVIVVIDRFFTNEFLENLNDSSVQSRPSSSTLTWNSNIEMANMIVLLAFGHASLLLFSLTKWSRLIDVLHSLEQQKYYEQEDFRKMQFCCQIGGGALVTVKLFYNCASL